MKKKSFGHWEALFRLLILSEKTGDTVNKYIRGNRISPREQRGTEACLRIDFFVEDLVHVQTDSREGPVVPHFAAVTLIANKTRGSLRGAGSYFDKFYVSFRFYYLFIARGYLSKFIIPLLRMKQFWNNTKTRLHLGVLLGLHRLRDFDGNQSLRIIDS